MKTTLFTILSLATGTLAAQQNMTLYQMHEITQSNTLNPALAGPCGWTIAVPALGNISAAASLPTAYNNIAAGRNKTITGNQILAQFHSTVALSAKVNINLLTIGYRTQQAYFQFTLNERLDMAASVAKTPLELALHGNAQFVGQTIDAQPTITTAYYREYTLSAAHNPTQGLWYGARLKLLFGRIGANGTNNKITLYTDPSTYDLTAVSDILVHASAPGQIAEHNPDGSIKRFKPELRAADIIFNPSNIGGAIDLGIIKTTDNQWRISASILNIGMINWSKNPRTLRQQTTVRYTGPTASINNWNDLLDTVRRVIRLHEYPAQGYTQWLSPTLMFGLSHPLHQHIRAGITGAGEYRAHGVYWALTATAFTEELQRMSAAVSYTIAPSSYLNLGLGLGLRFGPVNFHLATDNIIALFSPFTQRYATVQCGIHLRLGCNSSNSFSSDKKQHLCPAYR